MPTSNPCSTGKNSINSINGINYILSINGINHARSAARTLLHAAIAAVFGVAALVPAIGMAQAKNDPGHWYNPQGIVWKNSTGLCWRSSDWTPANATPECDPELFAKADAPAAKPVDAPVPRPAEAPAPAPAPMVAPAPAPSMQSRKVTFGAEELFDFDKATLRPAGMTGLNELVKDIDGVNYDMIVVSGHTDRIGTPQYNQKLSERRAGAVKAYLVSKGIAANRIESKGFGETQPLTKPGECKGPVGKALKACLQADRRVDVEVQGSKEVSVPQ